MRQHRGRILTWVIRIGVGLLAFLTLAVAEGIESETGTTASAGVGTFPLWLPIAVDLGAALMVFVVFFRWSMTRTVYTPFDNLESEFDASIVSKQGKRLGYGFLLLGSLAAVSSLVVLFMLEGAPENVRIVFERRIGLGDLGLLIFLGAATGIIGVGLCNMSRWARMGSVLWGFLLFGGLPIGTILAVYTWWFAASPAAVKTYRGTASRQGGAGKA